MKITRRFLVTMKAEDSEWGEGIKGANERIDFLASQIKKMYIKYETKIISVKELKD